MRKEIEQLVAPLGITVLTPIQEEALAQYKNYRETILYAPTGTGKTLAFLLPLVELLRSESASDGVRALILSPTRELATQIESVFKSLKTEFGITACYGGHSLQSEKNNLASNPAVVVGTPGRLVDHIEREHLKLKGVQFFIVDEFDKCLEMGFQEEISVIFKEMEKLNKLIFGSATKMHQFPEFIPLSNPVFIDRTQQDEQPDITLYGLKNLGDKLDTFKYLASQFHQERIIIFCNFREDVEDISAFLKEQNMAVAAYHGGLEQDERERALIKFRNNTSNLPDKLDAFIHRNGRTGRMTENGSAYLFLEDIKRAKFDVPPTQNFEIETHHKYVHPGWTTLYFSGGKKNKINKIDLLGFLCQQGDLAKEEVGVISILDYTSYASVKTKDVKNLLNKLRSAKVKGQKLKIDVAY
jgi:superfamily II DNA/RNA helicase